MVERWRAGSVLDRSVTIIPQSHATPPTTIPTIPTTAVHAITARARVSQDFGFGLGDSLPVRLHRETDPQCFKM